LQERYSADFLRIKAEYQSNQGEERRNKKHQIISHDLSGNTGNNEQIKVNLFAVVYNYIKIS
jgi:hypothetical protein